MGGGRKEGRRQEGMLGKAEDGLASHLAVSASQHDCDLYLRRVCI
jgi:hypothetical protein